MQLSKRLWCILLTAASTLVPSCTGSIRGNGRADAKDQVQLSSGRKLIIGGTVASRNQYPFFAVTAFQGTNTEDCGAALIHSDILLTAASCKDQFHRGVVLNPYDRTNPADGERLFVDLLQIHPEYQSYRLENNLMIVKLVTPSTQTPVAWNKNASNPQDTDVVTLVGMGNNDLSLTSPVSEFLQESEMVRIANTSIVDYLTCRGKLQLLFYNKSLFCTGRGKGLCYGDLGNPVLDSQGVLVGINSLGYCNSFPSLHTRVSHYDAWIQEMICTHSSQPPADCPALNTSQPPDTIAIHISYKANQGFSQSWRLYDADDQVIATNKLLGMIPGSAMNETVYVPRSRYTFLLSDAAFDVLGDIASLSVQDGTSNPSTMILHLRPNKPDKQPFPFYIPGGAYQPKPGNMSAPLVNVTLVVTYDNCQTWFIKDLLANKTVYQSPFLNCYLAPAGQVEANLTLIEGRSYLFSLYSPGDYPFSGTYDLIATYPGQGPGSLLPSTRKFAFNVVTAAFDVVLPTCRDQSGFLCNKATSLPQGSLKKNLWCKQSAVASACRFSCGTC